MVFKNMSCIILFVIMTRQQTLFKVMNRIGTEIRNKILKVDYFVLNLAKIIVKETKIKA